MRVRQIYLEYVWSFPMPSRRPFLLSIKIWKFREKYFYRQLCIGEDFYSSFKFLKISDLEPNYWFQDETYTLFMANNNWYLFLRLHQILCDRLNKMYNQAIIITNEETKERKDRKESTAIALRLKPKSKFWYYLVYEQSLVWSA